MLLELSDGVDTPGSFLLAQCALFIVNVTRGIIHPGCRSKSARSPDALLR